MRGLAKRPLRGVYTLGSGLSPFTPQRGLRVFADVLWDGGDAAYFAVVAPQDTFKCLEGVFPVHEHDLPVVHLDFECVGTHLAHQGFGDFLVGSRDE